MDTDTDTWIWKCPDCGQELMIDDWSYRTLVEHGTPICTKCDNDMELVDLQAFTNTAESSE